MKSHTRRIAALDPRNVRVRFPKEVQEAFGDLAAMLHFSEHVDSGLLETLKDLAAGKTLPLDDVIGSLPLLAAATIQHVQATGDEHAAKAWRDIASQLVEHTFSLADTRSSVRSRD